jgi:hypothetical protein
LPDKPDIHPALTGSVAPVRDEMCGFSPASPPGVRQAALASGVDGWDGRGNPMSVDRLPSDRAKTCSSLADAPDVAMYRQFDHGIRGWLSSEIGAPPAALDVAGIPLAQYFRVALGRSFIGVWLWRLPAGGGYHGGAVRPTDPYPILASAFRTLLDNPVSGSRSHSLFRDCYCSRPLFCNLGARPSSRLRVKIVE